MGDKDKNFVEYVVGAIVDNPDKVSVERKVDEMGVLLELTVAPEDMGKIIGKDGQTAKAIRTLLRVLGAQINARINLKIIEPDGGTGGRMEKPAEQPVSASTTTQEDLQELAEE